MTEENFEILYKQARKLFLREKTPEAKEKILELIELCGHEIQNNENNTRAYFIRGRAFNALKKYDDAISDYNEVIKLDKENATAYSNRANAYMRLKQYDKAIHDCSEAIKLDNKFAGAYSNRAVAYMKLGKYKEALEDAEQAIAIDKEKNQDSTYYSSHYSSLKAEIRFEKSQKDYEELEKRLKQSEIDFEKSQKDYEGLEKKLTTSTYDIIASNYGDESKDNHANFLKYKKQEQLWYIFVLLIIILFFIVNHLCNNIIGFGTSNDYDTITFFMNKSVLIVILIPAYLLTHSYKEMAARFRQRAELERDTNAIFGVYAKINSDLKNAPDNESTQKLKEIFIKEIMTNCNKTSFERLEESIANKQQKTFSLKKFDKELDIIEKMAKIVRGEKGDK